jgi:peptide chain release factor 3
MVVTHGRTGKPFATKYAHSVFGQERETLTRLLRKLL